MLKSKTLSCYFLDLVLFFALITAKLILFNENIEGAHSFNLVLISFATVFILVSLTILLPLKVRSIVLFVLDALITFILISDLLFFRYYNSVISIPVLFQANQVGTLEQSIYSLFKVQDLFYLFDLLFYLPLIYWIKKKAAIKSVSLKKKLGLAGIFLVLGTGLISYNVLALEKIMGKNIFVNILDQTFLVEKLNILNYHVFDVYKFTKKQLVQPVLAAQDKDNIQAWFVQQAQKNLQNKDKAQYFGAFKNKNLIIVQVEALQNFVINKKVNGQEIAPNLNQLIKKAAYFPNFYYQTAQGNTSDAEFLTNVSYYPAKEGSAYFQFTTNELITLPKLLEAQNYKTLVMHPYKPTYWNRAAMYHTIGFEKFYSRDNFTQDDLLGWGLSDKSFLKQAVNKLEQTKEPFYSFLITLSSHYPYDAFQKSNNLNLGQFENSFIGNYLEAVHYTDSALGEFIKLLQQKGLWDNSIVVIYGDHNGITKTEKQELLNFLQVPDTPLMWSELQKVPLFIHLPGEKETGIKNINGGQVDILPTVANLLGIQYPYAMGVDLFNAQNNLTIFRSGSFVDGNIRYLPDTKSIYNITTGQVLPLTQYQQQVNFVKEKLLISDQVLEYNLMPYLTSNKY
ncbi:LTA synthase family protein [Bacillota bacterium LX-D]|nr:LTA synthase family protein [Bacillota bacterium LX-D]